MNEYRACINTRLVNIKDKVDVDFSLKYAPASTIKLNDTGKMVLKGCIEQHTVAQIVEVISNKYEIEDKEVVLTDVLSILDKFFKMGVITWENDEFPSKNKYQEKKLDYTLKKYTINNVSQIFKEYDRYVLDAYSILKDEKNKNSITGAILSDSIGFYKIEDEVGNKIKLIVQFEKLINQLNIKAIQVEGVSYSANMFDELILWILSRQYKDKYYLEDGLESIPVIIYSNTDDITTYTSGFNFRNIGVLEKEVNNEDVNVYLKYYEIKDFR